MSRLRTLTKDGATHVALESRSGYLLLCRQDGLPGEVGVFGWSDERSFVLARRACPRCAELLASKPLLGSARRG